MADYKACKIGIIGGSGLYTLDSGTLLDVLKVKTPYGEPSDEVKLVEVGGVKVAFLSRHGAGHRLSPSEVPYRANIYALKRLGVETILSISAVGSLKEDIRPRDMVFPSQVIDRTKGRVSTFSEAGMVLHAPFAEPFCERLSGCVHDVFSQDKTHKAPVTHHGGTYVCIEGPALSTRAESHLYRSWGGSLIGMTALPEATLAREAEICYSLMAMVTDYDCWREKEDVSIEAILDHMQHNTTIAKQYLPSIIRAMDLLGECIHHSCMRHAILTDKTRIPEDVFKKIAEPFYAKYF